MQEVFALIEKSKKEFTNLELFEYMQDKSITPSKRLSFAPCMTHFIMSFGDLNKYVFKEAQPVTKLQHIINEHANEDEEHWRWFVTDLEKLNCDPIQNFSKALKSIWSEETKITRQISYYVAGYTLTAEPIIKIAAIEALEAVGNVFFCVSSQVASELNKITRKDYLYFGESHLKLETGHTVGTPEAEDFLAKIQLTDSQRQQAFEIVEKIFQIFTEWTYELLAYAQKYGVESIENQAEAVLMACI
ncbi:hypothetical protein NIES267_15120 [Calothrix parasitica NIES-267]|uniref:Uncharacterized protein n=1 Tax=Calothrix parasitica NIES-267 TaxID=1973488 RepID=A0A1Z4LLH6_9CYAN|nr:hypothetical protein NIES267_15120 [Calothrix parasitica NIES-267]